MGSEGGDDDSINDEDFESVGGKCGLIFLIDCRSSMFTKDITDDDDGSDCSRFNIAIKCCRNVLMNKIISRQKDVVGVVLFGTDKADPKTNTKHVSLLLELNYPSAAAVKQLDQLLNDGDSLEFQRTYGSSDNFLLADALWYCSSLFSHSGTAMEEKRIILFTDDSEPHAAHPDRAHMARKRAKDLYHVNITLELLPVGNSFDYSKSYKELVEIVNGSAAEEIDAASKLEQLMERVNRLDFKTRRYSKIKWNLGKGVCLGVSLYTLYREATVLPKESLNRATNEPVKRVKQMYDQLIKNQTDINSALSENSQQFLKPMSSVSCRKPLVVTNELLLPSDIVEYTSIGGEEIVFTNEEKEMMKQVMEPGLTLLGFKPASVVTAGIHSGQPAFAYPEETLIKGSRELMKALVERCIAKDRVALCCITPRHRALTKFVYLVPTMDTYDENGRQSTPCGFHVIPLPFYNDSREMTFEKSREVTEEKMEVARKLVNKLKFTFKPSNFKNPKLQQFWSHLEAHALEYEAPEALIDQSLPDVEAQTERLGQLSADFNETFSLSGGPATVAKRSQAAGTSNSPKRTKVAMDANEVTNAIRASIGTKKVEKFTVAQLKDFLSLHNQDTAKMKKADLVNAVNNLEL